MRYLRLELEGKGNRDTPPTAGHDGAGGLVDRSGDRGARRPIFLGRRLLHLGRSGVRIVVSVRPMAFDGMTVQAPTRLRRWSGKRLGLMLRTLCQLKT